MKRRGLFITVEGVEGVGKSTNIAFLQDYLASRGVDLVLTREPGGTPMGEKIRDFLLNGQPDDMDGLTELLLIFAARAQHISALIEPALAAGKWVLSDRFTDATYAYQGAGRGLAIEDIRRLEDLVQKGMKPDYTLLLDADVATGLSRVARRGEPDRIERERADFFERVRGQYLELAESGSGRYRVIDASKSLDAVQRQLEKIARELLACWNVRSREAP